ncbi:cupin domain-containing protein [Novosphingobium lentum]|uniref:cupin domain-containing protein n=1 Tax=Novosphingobium lentum TaxID=145287 RepID=UPI00082AEE91|nr:cupin domain-containing protein [Novosphingobium lentum]
MQLRDFDIDAFLRTSWQKRPVVIRDPWTAWTNPLDPDELAGLACEDDVESRIVLRTGNGANGIWKLEHGPFTEARFGKLGKARWTLLVQAVDHQVADVAALIAPFRFVPNWRVDDVMVSYAADGGGVGPHFDQYDVFLVQGLGQRRWQVGAPCDAATPLLPHDDLRLLADFAATEEWLLEPGDILYVPPGVPHNGVAVGDDCMTYSIGFRAPSRSELIAHWCEDVLDGLADDDRYADPDLVRPDNPGEIPGDTIAALHAMVTDALRDRDTFARWFGRHNTARKYPEVDWQPGEAVPPGRLRKMMARGVALLRNPASRFAFIRTGPGTVQLFVDGDGFECSGHTVALAERLCAQDRIELSAGLATSDDDLALIARLLAGGSVAVEAND